MKKVSILRRIYFRAHGENPDAPELPALYGYEKSSVKYLGYCKDGGFIGISEKGWRVRRKNKLRKWCAYHKHEFGSLRKREVKCKWCDTPHIMQIGRVGRSPDWSKVLILTDEGFAASRIDGVWRKGIHFSADEQENELQRLCQVDTADNYYREALKALESAT